MKACLEAAQHYPAAEKFLSNCYSSKLNDTNKSLDFELTLKTIIYMYYDNRRRMKIG